MAIDERNTEFSQAAGRFAAMESIVLFTRIISFTGILLSFTLPLFTGVCAC